jgi:hypothetical protein
VIGMNRCSARRRLFSCRVASIPCISPRMRRSSSHPPDSPRSHRQDARSSGRSRGRTLPVERRRRPHGTRCQRLRGSRSEGRCSRDHRRRSFLDRRGIRNRNHRRRRRLPQRRSRLRLDGRVRCRGRRCSSPRRKAA